MSEDICQLYGSKLLYMGFEQGYSILRTYLQDSGLRPLPFRHCPVLGDNVLIFAMRLTSSDFDFTGDGTATG